jgi:mRNA interferase MazF
VEVNRGDVVVVASRGAYTSSKPRPALIVQADPYNDTHASITICPITSDALDAPLFRVALPPGERTGLQVSSQVMVDKLVSVPREAIGPAIGSCNLAEMEHVGAALRSWLAF